jgi:RNA polymerase sigma factor (sigma-70 family)
MTPDEDLMDAYCAGDIEAFDALYARFEPRLLRFVRSFVGGAHAEDVVQQTFIRMHEQRHKFASGTRVGAWIFTIARNMSIDLKRRPSFSRSSSIDDDNAPELVAQEGKARDPWLSARVFEAVSALPDAQRDVVSLHFIGGLSFAEVAEMLSLKPDAVRARAARAYEELRGTLGELEAQL